MRVTVLVALLLAGCGMSQAEIEARSKLHWQEAVVASVDSCIKNGLSPERDADVVTCRERHVRPRFLALERAAVEQDRQDRRERRARVAAASMILGNTTQNMSNSYRDRAQSVSCTPGVGGRGFDCSPY